MDRTKVKCAEKSSPPPPLENDHVYSCHDTEADNESEIYSSHSEFHILSVDNDV